MMAARSLPEKYVSIDVECVSTGPRHDARAVALVAVIDQDERVLLKKKVKPKEKVMSYLTPLTGIREGDLDDGEPLEKVVAEVKGLLGSDVVLVGQIVKSDVLWLQLREGKDYESTVELGDLFKTYNPRYERDNFFSLSHEANTLLRFTLHAHDQVTDAKACILLFKKYYANSAMPSKSCCTPVPLPPGLSRTTTAGRVCAWRHTCPPSASAELPPKRLPKLV